MRKLAEVGLLTARKSVGVPESRGGGAAGMIGGRSAFSRTLSRIVLFCPALVARWRQAGATQIGRVGRYRRVLECQSPRPVLASLAGCGNFLAGQASVCVGRMRLRRRARRINREVVKLTMTVGFVDEENRTYLEDEVVVLLLLLVVLLQLVV